MLFNSALNSLFSPLHDDGLRTSLSEVGGGEESMHEFVCMIRVFFRSSFVVSHEPVNIIRHDSLSESN